MKESKRLEISAALAVGLVGAVLILMGTGYSLGTLRRIGPGFFPLVVGSILLLLSGGLIIEARRFASVAQERLMLRPLIMVMAAILAFGVLMERAGLVPATCALVILSALAERPFRPITTLVSALALSLFGILVFVYALGLPLSAF